MDTGAINMGNCCKVTNKTYPKILHPELNIQINDEKDLKLKYNPSNSLQSILDQLRSNDLLPASTFRVFKNNLEILNYSLSVQELALEVGDKLSIREKPKCLETNQFEDIAEEETTTKKKVEMIKPKFRRTSSEAESGSSLWQTALPSPKVPKLSDLQVEQISSQGTPAEMTLSEVKHWLDFQMHHSDDSFSNNVTNLPETHSVFKDLLGPFALVKLN